MIVHKHYEKPDENYNRRHLVAIASLGASVGGAVGLAGPLTFGTSLAIGAGTLAVGGFAASTLLSGLSPSLPNVPQTAAQGLPQAPTIEQTREDTREEQLEILRRKRAGTILTSPEGLLSTSDVSGKTLLGA
jgi:hypothetical protein